MMHKILNQNVVTSGSKIYPFSKIPGPKPFPVVGTLPHYIAGKYDTSSAYKTCLQKYYEFGNIYKEKLFQKTIVYLVNPKDVEAVFRSSGYPQRLTHEVLEYVRKHEFSNLHHNGGIFMENGESWAGLRQAFQKDMAMSIVSSYVEEIGDIAEATINFCEKPAREDNDFLNTIFAYTTDCTIFSLFGEKLNSVHHVCDPKSVSSRLIAASTELNHATGPTDHGPQMWKYVATKHYKIIRNCCQELDNISAKLLESRIVDGKLSSIPSSNAMVDLWIRSGKVDLKMLQTFVADNILAGIDTMAYTLSFVLYHLSANPKCQEKLYNEILKISGRSGKAGKLFDEIVSSSYLKKCFKEANRLHPLTLGIGRILNEDLVLSNYHVPAGTQIVTANQVMSRLPDNVDYPNKFIPERYDVPTPFNKIHPFVSLPFSYGPRACIGRRLAEQCIYVFIYKLFKKYHVDWAGSRPLNQITQLINKPDAPLHFKFTRKI